MKPVVERGTTVDSYLCGVTYIHTFIVLCSNKLDKDKGKFMGLEFSLQYRKLYVFYAPLFFTFQYLYAFIKKNTYTVYRAENKLKTWLKFISSYYETWKIRNTGNRRIHNVAESRGGTSPVSKGHTWLPSAR